jgi:dihydrofolate reductase
MPDSKPRISLIAAIGKNNRALGKDNQLLWHIPDDLKRFKEITSGHPVIMGRKTWESLPEKFRPLPGRLNIVVTRQSDYEAEGATVCQSLELALSAARNSRPFAGVSEIFIIGGGELYKEVLPFADRLYLTLINEEKDGDVFFPDYTHDFTKKIFEESREYNDLKYTWVNLERA